MRSTARILLAASFLFTGKTSGGESIPQASYRDDRAKVAELLKSGVDPSQVYLGTTGLHICAEWGYADIAEILLKSGAKKDAVDSYQRSPLIWATLNNHPDVARLLIDAGCDINWYDERGNSALSGAAENNDLELVQL